MSLWDECDDSTKAIFISSTVTTGVSGAGSATGTSLSCGTNPAEIFDENVIEPVSISCNELSSSVNDLFDSFYDSSAWSQNSTGYWTNDDSPADMWTGLCTTLAPCLSSAGGGEVLYIVLIPVGGDSSNAIAYDRVELSARCIYNKYDKKHAVTKVGNAAIICEDIAVIQEIRKISRAKEKNTLLNELEALKQYRDDNKVLQLTRGK